MAESGKTTGLRSLTRAICLLVAAMAVVAPTHISRAEAEKDVPLPTDHDDEIQAVIAALTGRSAPNDAPSRHARSTSRGGGGGAADAFSWHDCSAAGSPVHVEQLQVAPTPIQLPGTVTVTLAVTSTEVLAAPIALSVQIYKKSGDEWGKAPCINNVGSCDYPDICEKLKETFPGPTYPQAHGQDVLNSTHVHCPVQAAVVKMHKQFPLKLPRQLPPPLLQGDFKVIANATGNGASGRFNFCMEMFFSVHVNDS